jgi:hypothetical protein
LYKVGLQYGVGQPKRPEGQPANYGKLKRVKKMTKLQTVTTNNKTNNKKVNAKRDAIVPVTPVEVVAELTLDEKMDRDVKAYKTIKGQAKKSLLAFKIMGDTFNLIRADFDSDKLYGKHLQTTPMAAIDRRDRANMVWLADNWLMIDTFKKTNGVETNSIAYLKTLVKKAQDDEKKRLADLENVDSSDNEETEQPEAPEGTGVAGSDIVKKSVSDVELVAHMLELCSANGLDPKLIATMFKNAAKSA